MELEENEGKVIIRSKEKKKGKSSSSSSCELGIMRLASLAISFNVRLKSSDMPLYMQEHAIRYTSSLLALHHPSTIPSNTHLASALKKEFDSAYGLVWHCVIGKSFGSFVSHTGGGFLYFSVNNDSLSVLLFKTEVHLLMQPPTPPSPP